MRCLSYQKPHEGDDEVIINVTTVVLKKGFTFTKNML